MKILITYSSGFGSTAEVSVEIGKILAEEKDFNVEVKSIDDITRIDEYEVIIVGSSVRADRPLANVRDFFALHRFELPQKKLAIFAVCLTANNEEGKEKVKKEYISPILQKYPNLHPISTQAFGGKIDFNRLNPVMQQLMIRVLEKTGLPTTGSVDTRNWEEIRQWALEIKKKLKSNGKITEDSQ